MVAEDSLNEKNSSKDDSDLEAGTKLNAIQGNLLRSIDNKTVKGQFISKGFFGFFQFFQKTNEKFLPLLARAKIKVFKFVFLKELKTQKSPFEIN